MSKAVDCINGFMKIRRTGHHATLWVEGLDDQEPSVAAVAMTKAQVESLKRKVDGMLEHWPEESLWDRIGAIAIERMANGERCDEASIHPIDFHMEVSRTGGMVRYRKIGNIESVKSCDWHEEYVTLFVGGKRVIVLSNPTVDQGNIAFDKPNVFDTHHPGVTPR